MHIYIHIYVYICVYIHIYVCIHLITPPAELRVLKIWFVNRSYVKFVTHSYVDITMADHPSSETQGLESACSWRAVAVCCGVLRCVAVCCSVLQCVAVCFSVLHCAAVCRSVL